MWLGRRGDTMTAIGTGPVVFQSFAHSSARLSPKLAKLQAPVGPGFVGSDDAVVDGTVRPGKAEWALLVDACNSLTAGDSTDSKEEHDHCGDAEKRCRKGTFGDCTHSWASPDDS